MSDDAEWGPWIEHDGKGCPCRGYLVDVERANGETSTFVAGNGTYETKAPTVYCAMKTGSWWLWVSREPMYGEIVRYRIRKPKGMSILNAILENLPAKTPRQDA